MKTRKKRRISFPARLRYGAEAALVYIVYGFNRLLPLDTASGLWGRLLRLIGPGMGISRVARRNLALAFPEKTESEREDILKGMWENIGRVIGEYAHLHRIWPRVELEGKQHIEEVIARGQPAFFVGGHVGNWEVCPLAARHLGLPLTLVYRRPNNPLVDRLLCHARSAGSDESIAKGTEGARAMLSALRGGQSLGVLLDQKLNEGIAVPFFGHPAMTAPAVAQFSLKFNYPIIPIWCRRIAGARFKITTLPPLAIERTGDTKQDIYNILLAINHQLEQWIRAAPEQWLWIHRRWPDHHGSAKGIKKTVI